MRKKVTLALQGGGARVALTWACWMPSSRMAGSM